MYKTPSEITISLQQKSIEVHFEDSIDFISNEYKNKENTLVIYTPAVPKNHTELNFFFNNKYLQNI